MEQFKYLKSESCSFTGHRDMATEKIRTVKTKLKAAIEQCYDEGITNFVCGMALGFDMLGAETVLAMKDEYPDLTLTAVVPFRGQADRWAISNQRRYESILDEADQVIVMSEHFFKGCEMKRNTYMVEHSCRLISYFNGEEHGGTFFTYRSAKERKMPIINLF